MKGLKQRIDRIKPDFEKGGRFEKLHSVFDGFYTFLFTPNETSSSGVHIHDGSDSKRTMITVVMALLPCCLFGMWNIGLQHYRAIGELDHSFFELFFYGFFAVLPQILTAYIVGLGIEFIVAQLRGHEIQEGFLVSGILIPMICPVDTPCWMLAIAVAFAVIFAKEVFGGTGYNFLNIALVTRAFLFFSYPSKMSGDNVFVSLGGSQAADSYTGATPLGQLASATEPGTVITNVLGDPLSFSDIFFRILFRLMGRDFNILYPYRCSYPAFHWNRKLENHGLGSHWRIAYECSCKPFRHRPLSGDIPFSLAAAMSRRIHVRDCVYGDRPCNSMPNKYR